MPPCFAVASSHSTTLQKTFPFANIYSV
jgi:hypothetical protein